MIQQQGEMLDNIESNLIEANDYLDKAEASLENAQNIHKKNRSKCFGILILVVVLGIVGVLWVLGII